MIPTDPLLAVTALLVKLAEANLKKIDGTDRDNAVRANNPTEAFILTITGSGSVYY
ncbi:MAG: hypothetical protein ACRECH_10900 [Nitrososphaerales archaeon]